MRRAFITMLARLAGVITAFFILGFACGTVVDAAFMPRKLTVIDETVKPAEMEAVEPLKVAAPENGITDAETDENFEIEFALFQKSTDWAEFEATAYCGCEVCCGKWSKYHRTYTGAVPQEGITIAVDPDVIPLGSQVFVQLPNDDIDVWHCYTAQDIGGAIKGNRIDIYFEDHEDALKFGRQTVLLCYTAPDAA